MRKRSTPLQVYVTDEEDRMIRKKAHDNEMSLSEFVRSACLAYEAPKPLTEERVREIVDTRIQLWRGAPR